MEVQAGAGVRSVSDRVTEEPVQKDRVLVVQPYGDRYFALYDGEDLVCVTVYKKGALEVKKRLEATHNLTPKEGDKRSDHRGKL